MLVVAIPKAKKPEKDPESYNLISLLCFLNQLQGLKIIVNLLHVLKSGLVLESKF